jgi:primosomal protein N' (replication factor Y)
VHNLQPIGYEVANVIEVLEKKTVLTPLQMQLLDWISEYYMAPPGITYHAALPSGFKISTESKIQLNPNYEEEKNEEFLTTNEQLLIELLKNMPSISYLDAMKALKTKALYKILLSLRKKEAILLFEEYKHLYKPKIVQKIRLAERFVHNKDLLKALLDKKIFCCVICRKCPFGKSPMPMRLDCPKIFFLVLRL